MTAGSLKIAIQKEFAGLFTTSVLKKTGDKMAAEILRLMWERTDSGYDINGRRWRRHKAKNYDKIKRKYGKRADANWIDLTGDLKRSLNVKYKGSDVTTKTVTLKFAYEIPPDQLPKVEGLLSTTGYDRNREAYTKVDWQFLGLSKTGVWKSKEDRAIANIIRQQIGTARSKFTKKQSITI